MKLADVAAVPATGITVKQDLAIGERLHTDQLTVRAMVLLRAFTLFVVVVTQSAVRHDLQALVDLVSTSRILHSSDHGSMTRRVEDNAIFDPIRSSDVEGRET